MAKRKSKDDAEDAYRRGVHQTLDAIQGFWLVDSGTITEGIALLREATALAREIRSDRKDHPRLLDEIWKRLGGKADGVRSVQEPGRPG